MSQYYSILNISIVWFDLNGCYRNRSDTVTTKKEISAFSMLPRTSGICITALHLYLLGDTEQQLVWMWSHYSFYAQLQDFSRLIPLYPKMSSLQKMCMDTHTHTQSEWCVNGEGEIPSDRFHYQWEHGKLWPPWILLFLVSHIFTSPYMNHVSTTVIEPSGFTSPQQWKRVQWSARVSMFSSYASSHLLQLSFSMS